MHIKHRHDYNKTRERARFNTPHSAPLLCGFLRVFLRRSPCATAQLRLCNGALRGGGPRRGLASTSLLLPPPLKQPPGTPVRYPPTDPGGARRLGAADLLPPPSLSIPMRRKCSALRGGGPRRGLASPSALLLPPPLEQHRVHVRVQLVRRVWPTTSLTRNVSIRFSSRTASYVVTSHAC